jgi:ferritin
MDLAIQEKDHLSGNILQWLANEQFEAVSSMETLPRMIQRVGESGLLFVESYLAQNRQGATTASEGAS